MEMDFPQLYRQVAFLPKRDANIALKQFSTNNKWKENAYIIDFGSGDGSTTTNILQKYLPICYKKIIGCDKSAKMVEFANENYGTNKIEFIKWDITDELPQHLRGAFDHAFSSYTLQRIKQQTRAFTNIYDSLKVGGSCLLLFLGRYPAYDIFRALSLTKKWAEDLKNVEMFISPYHDSQVW
ncbi:juvenile hormone acid O-methyltransferase-like [Cydia amplana]|uniref:juvenile hormone acid O-methyltransferase-like n=1 Tax=Cydia amplana TaxID=1869771 RepID=UPI002FE631B5